MSAENTTPAADSFGNRSLFILTYADALYLLWLFIYWRLLKIWIYPPGMGQIHWVATCALFDGAGPAEYRLIRRLAFQDFINYSAMYLAPIAGTYPPWRWIQLLTGYDVSPGEMNWWTGFPYIIWRYHTSPIVWSNVLDAFLLCEIACARDMAYLDVTSGSTPKRALLVYSSKLGRFLMLNWCWREWPDRYALYKEDDTLSRSEAWFECRISIAVIRWLADGFLRSRVGIRLSHTKGRV